MYVYKSVAESKVANAAFRAISLATQSPAATGGGKAPVSPRGPFVPEVLKTVWTMCWKRWYDYVSCAFRAFFEDEKESRIKGWRRKRRRSRHFCPQCGQLTGVSAQSVVAPFEENFRAAGVLVPANVGVPRNLVVPYGRFGELWVRKTWRTLHTDSGANRAYFAPL